MALSLEQASLAQLSQLRWTPMYRRVRAFVDGRVIVDSTDAIQVWEPHRVVGSYAVPAADVAVPLDHPTPVSPVDDHPPILTPEHPFSMHTAAGSSCDVSAGPRVLAGAAFRPDDPDLAGYVLLDWNAFDEWREEEQIVMGHPHDPSSGSTASRPAGTWPCGSGTPCSPKATVRHCCWRRTSRHATTSRARTCGWMCCSGPTP